MKKTVLFLTILLIADIQAQCKVNNFPIRKYYLTNGLDGAIFSTAMLNKTTLVYPVGGGNPMNVSTNSLSGLRFTLFINSGTTLHYNFSSHVGVYTGIDIKNIGFIEYETINNSHYTIKRRTYNIGVPLVLKLGDVAMSKRGVLLLGGGIDVPINYKEKSFINRGNKKKFNEWFSNRTPLLMPYLCAGVVTKNGVSLKIQYYPGNFLNPNYTDGNGNKPYYGYDVHLVFVTIGYVFRMFDFHKDVHPNEGATPSVSVR